MNRIEKLFKGLKARNKKAFIPYIMAGDPSLEKTKEIVLMFEECGADIVELGVPFTDPLADGPTIQRAAERALKNGVTLKKAIAFVKDLRQKTKIPLVLMTYYNPIFKYGEGRFLADAKDAGVDGVIIPDLPPDEAGEFTKLAKNTAMAAIFLLAPTSTADRIKKVAGASRGFIYYVSITGITGAQLLLDGSIETSINDIRRITDKPVAVGFGVSTPDEAKAVAGISDGVIIGSAIVKKAQEGLNGEFRNFLLKLREAIK
ncbi:MAG: tryptophan synthase subunit alpha [Nitrospirae bacterium RIFOXYB2_FULL_43_5]|nr:MAG: tryptophan synthase subunit alpha [Nitrospirae bacterium GWF2_44_13]OGW63855.1 MAG: tryptophan synthase subunit alpha [Nitrospirae bacterium RIFOXYA2_FULL_44_9]OGW78095.1 MAG: tryptophan synthase subunit alpha [Nitrospirae bacterium RIFOXYB2_FULL_43_5]HBG92060.1 tryptophan synthase subunit alpha [Nitrospiraceae bacterium]